jgi:hypothetical protein
MNLVDVSYLPTAFLPVRSACLTADPKRQPSLLTVASAVLDTPDNRGNVRSAFEFHGSGLSASEGTNVRLATQGNV